jgi:hypothetical protein
MPYGHYTPVYSFFNDKLVYKVIPSQCFTYSSLIWRIEISLSLNLIIKAREANHEFNYKLAKFLGRYKSYQMFEGNLQTFDGSHKCLA